MGVLGKELLDQAYYTRAIQTLQIAIDREPENVDALILMAQAYTELDRVDEEHLEHYYSAEKAKALFAED